jgi:hypothetical protein
MYINAHNFKFQSGVQFYTDTRLPFHAHHLHFKFVPTFCMLLFMSLLLNCYQSFRSILFNDPWFKECRHESEITLTRKYSLWHILLLLVYQLTSTHMNIISRGFMLFDVNENAKVDKLSWCYALPWFCGFLEIFTTICYILCERVLSHSQHTEETKHVKR